MHHGLRGQPALPVEPAAVERVVVEALDVHRRQLRQLRVAKRRHKVLVDDPGIALVRLTRDAVRASSSHCLSHWPSVSLPGSTCLPTSTVLRRRRSSRCAPRFVPRTVAYFVMRLPVLASRPMSYFSSTHLGRVGGCVRRSFRGLVVKYSCK
jgi:hypothetical protein